MPPTKSVDEELKEFQLEESRERVHNMRQRREGIRRRIEGRDRDLQLANARQKAKEDACWHKKGGKGVEMLSRGNDHNYAVVKHTLAHGPTIVVCQRCGHVAEPPPQALNRRSASKEDKAEYKRLYDEYMWWLNLPTDNAPSGTQLFVITQDDVAA